MDNSFHNSYSSDSISIDQPEIPNQNKNLPEISNLSQKPDDNLLQNGNENENEKENENSIPLPQNLILPTPSAKDSKWFFENLMDKLSQKKSQTISVSIFIFLRDNNYKPMSQQALLDKLSEKFRNDPKSLLKYKTIRDHFTNESQIKNGFIAAIRENMGLKKTKINNIDYIGVNFDGIIEYFRNLKIRHASQGILDDDDVKFLFPDITELTLTGKKRLRKYYPSTTRQKRHKKINFGLDDYTSISKERVNKKFKKNHLHNRDENNENDSEDDNFNFNYQNNYGAINKMNPNNINTVIYLIISH